jgi:hypothetical protein
LRATVTIERQKIRPCSRAEVMNDERSAWDKTFYHRVIQTKIGQVLRAQYGRDYLAQPLPHRLLTLLMQLSEQEDTGRGERPEQSKPPR